MQYNAQEIVKALDNKDLVLLGCKENLQFSYSQVQAASVDLRLDNRFVRFLPDVDCIDIKMNTNSEYLESKTQVIYLKENEPLVLEPHEIVLGQVYEIIALNDCMAGRIEGRSRVARLGITVHCTGSYINPGYHGVMPLQIINHNNFKVQIYPYIGICQLILFHLKESPIIKYGSYNHYQGENTALLSNLSHSEKRNPVDKIIEDEIDRAYNTYLENHRDEKGISLADKDSVRLQGEIRKKLKEFIKDNYIPTLSKMLKKRNLDLTKMEKEAKNKKDFVKELKNCNILLLTASPLEDAMLTWFLWQQNKKHVLKKYTIKGFRIQIGTMGGKQVAHVAQQDIGSCNAERAVRTALTLFTPKIVVSIGVAYGINYKDQKIGDVLVSERIIDIDKKHKLTNGVYTFSSDLVCKSDAQIIESWKHYLEAKNHMKKFDWQRGTLLSKGTVLSDAKEKERLIDAAKRIGETELIGGEMEGAGITRVCNDKSLPTKWIVIKGICDWGEQKNELGEIARELGIAADNDSLKDSIQAYAACNAFASLKELIKKAPSAIDEL